jgi:16S rRNA (uracil1498-N3)-methyltransferase
MRNPRARLIVPGLPALGGTVRLSPEEAAHANARRLRVGDAVLLSDGSGRSALSEIVRLSRGEVIARVREIVAGGRGGVPISLYLAGLRPERLAWAVEKATELGTARVVVVASDRTQSFRASAGLMPRLDRVARESSKQCGRPDWPAVSGPVDLASVLEKERCRHRLFLDFDGDRFPRRMAAAPSALLVGPEGGWTDDERERAVRHGWKVVALPAGLLRAETAAVAALVLLRFASGAGPRKPKTS